MPGIATLLRTYFFSGLLVIIPLAVIFWILSGVFDSIWQLREYVPDPLRPDNYISDPTLAKIVDGAISIGIAVGIALATSLLGWISSRYLGRKILELLGYLIQRIPIIRSVYSALDQLLRAFTGSTQQFSRVVYVEWPRKGTWTLAFVTGKFQGHVLPAGHLTLFVPATPNPTAGFYVVVHESEVKESGLKVEEAIKVILSLGVAHG